MALNISKEIQPNWVSIELEGEVDTKSAPQLLEVLTEIGLPNLTELRILADKLSFMSSAGLRALVFAKQKMPHESKLILVGGSDEIQEVITRTGLGSAVVFAGSVDELD